MSKEPNQPKLEAAIAKLQTFITTRQRMKSDEELASTFESFLVSYPESLSGDEMQQHLEDLKALEEFLPVLYELEAELRRR